VALKPEESAFVEKTLHYISSIHGAVSTDLTLSTNTKYPTRYVIMIRGLPLIHMGDFETIYNTNGLIREMKVNMLESSLRIDVWRGNATVRKRKKKRRLVESSACRLVCDMSNVDNRDTKCLTQLLKLLSGMENVECQFTVQVNTSNPEYYGVDLHILDSICIQEIKHILHQCRNFCSDISFDFPHKIVRAKCLRLAAPLRRRTLTLKK
tara:strand:- start:2977 stop:3603 length:627 start_codon:yes stop_codon:yes gene_type:complete